MFCHSNCRVLALPERVEVTDSDKHSSLPLFSAEECFICEASEDLGRFKF